MTLLFGAFLWNLPLLHLTTFLCWFRNNTLPVLLVVYINSTWLQLLHHSATISPLPHQLPVETGLRLRLAVTFYVSSGARLVLLRRVRISSPPWKSTKKKETAVSETAVDAKRRLARRGTWNKLHSTSADKTGPYAIPALGKELRFQSQCSDRLFI